MNIGICLDKSDFLYDIHSLVKSFFPDDDVNIYTDGDAEKCSTARDLLLRVNIPEYTDRKNAKDALKRELYESLSDLTGRTLPWGTLSGIRPTKIPMKMLEEGMTREEIRRNIRETYLTSDAKIDLAVDVASNERRILSGVPTGQDTYSLYLHVPFCPSICLYCTFSASPVSAWQKSMDDYVDAVILEMERNEMLGLPLEPGKEPVRCSAGGRKPVTFYMGGGTPTSLSPEQLDRLLTAAEKYYDLGGCLERTVEAGRPDSITMEKLEVLKKHRITRISVNPQTMNQKTLDLIGRRHTVEDTVRAFEMARRAGFDNINMDIIPLREEHMAGKIEDYSRYGGLSFYNSEAIIGAAYDAAYRMGMQPYYLYRQKNMKGGLENTGFARKGCECLYNILIMEELQEIHAFGAGASTKVLSDGGRIDRLVNPKDVKTYLERVAVRTSGRS